MQCVDIENIRLYHIVHIDKLSSILYSGSEGQLLCDKDVIEQNLLGTTIGMNKIKNRRLRELTLNSYPDLYVGYCVPFYFCPRSIMLYMFYQNNHLDIDYLGGQEPIVHLVFNLRNVVDWANQNRQRWVFTGSNAGSRYFNDYCDLQELNALNWDAINTNDWSNCKEEKQAEFLVEKSVSWHLVEEIGVYSLEQYNNVCTIIASALHKPPIKVKREWYY